MKILLGVGLVILSFYACILVVFGNHGHIMFRPWMQEDWWLWGITVVAGISGVTLLVTQIAKKFNKEN